MHEIDLPGVDLQKGAPEVVIPLLFSSGARDLYYDVLCWFLIIPFCRPYYYYRPLYGDLISFVACELPRNPLALFWVDLLPL